MSSCRNLLVRLGNGLEQLEIQILPQFQAAGGRRADEIDEDVSVHVLKKVETVGIGEEAVEQFLVVDCIVVRLLIIPFLNALLVRVEDCYSGTVGDKMRKSTRLAVRIFVVTRWCLGSDFWQSGNETDFLVVGEAF